MKKFMFALLALSFAQSVWAYGIGMSTYPLSPDKGLISGELTGIMSNGTGMGIQGRYTCLLYTSPSPRDGLLSRMPSSA